MSPWGPGVVYSLCLATSVLCAGLLARAWRRSRSALLAWSSVAFALLALNNLAVVADVLILPDVDLTIVRQATALAAVGVLIYAFLWEIDR